MIRIWLQEPDTVGRWIAPRVNINWHPESMFAIGVGHHENGPSHPNGAVLFENIIPDGSLHCHVAGEGGRFLTRDFLWAVAWYAFERVHANKIITITKSTNEDGLAINKRIGFVHECTIKDAFPDSDAIIRTMTRKQCRWLDHTPSFLKDEEEAA